MESNEGEGKKHEDDRLKNSEGAKSQFGQSAGASVVGRTSVLNMKNLEKKNKNKNKNNNKNNNKKKDPNDDIRSDVDRD